MADVEAAPEGQQGLAGVTGVPVLHSISRQRASPQVLLWTLPAGPVHRSKDEETGRNLQGRGSQQCCPNLTGRLQGCFNVKEQRACTVVVRGCSLSAEHCSWKRPMHEPPVGLYGILYLSCCAGALQAATCISVACCLHTAAGATHRSALWVKSLHNKTTQVAITDGKLNVEGTAVALDLGSYWALGLPVRHVKVRTGGVLHATCLAS